MEDHKPAQFEFPTTQASGGEVPKSEPDGNRMMINFIFVSFRLHATLSVIIMINFSFGNVITACDL